MASATGDSEEEDRQPVAPQPKRAMRLGSSDHRDHRKTRLWHANRKTSPRRSCAGLIEANAVPSGTIRWLQKAADFAGFFYAAAPAPRIADQHSTK
jgi:hypothetical protein